MEVLRSLSFWSNYNLSCLCCFIVLILNTCPLVYSGDNSTVTQCQCNSPITGCNCTYGTNNCTTGFDFVNGTCVKCVCNSTKMPTNCNCSSGTELKNKLTCLPGQFLAISSHKCENCSCNVHTSFNNNCNNKTGQCPCQEHVTGLQCRVCAANFTANHSNSGELFNCFNPCHKDVKRNGCGEENSTISLTSTNVLISTSKSIPIPTDRVSYSRITSTTVSTIMSTSIQLTWKTSSTYLVPAFNSSMLTTLSPSITRVLATKKLTSMKIPSTAKTSLLSLSSSSVSQLLSSTLSPSLSPSLLSLSSLPSVIPTATTQTSKPTADDVPTTGQEPTMKQSTKTNQPSSQKPTTEVHHTKMPDKDNSSDVVVIVLTCVGVLVILGVAIAVGCWCLRSKRKPSTPFWTVELSNTRNNEESDFALLDPVTDEPHKKPTDTSEADASVTEHARYYAYI